ncbi:MAG: hypothetical protein R3B06_15005 [Kofleriaceae bacterium]
MMRIALALSFVALACSPRDEASPKAAMTSRPAPTTPIDCRALLTAWVVEGTLADSAHGIGQCTAADATAVLGDGEAGHGRLGGTGRDWTRWQRGEATVRAFWGADGHALLVVIDRPSAGDASAWRARLGEPEATWPSRTKRMDWTIKDHVFAARGITASIGESLLEPPVAPSLQALYLYEPTTVDAYVSDLGGKDEWTRKFPLR